MNKAEWIAESMRLAEQFAVTYATWINQKVPGTRYLGALHQRFENSRAALLAHLNTDQPSALQPFVGRRTGG